jgi:hypothetical protein
MLVPRIERLVQENWEPDQFGWLQRSCVYLASTFCFVALACVNPLIADAPPEKPLPAARAPHPVATKTDETSQTPSPDDSTRAMLDEFAELEKDLARCSALASQSDHEELRILADMLHERARLLKEFLQK